MTTTPPATDAALFARRSSLTEPEYPVDPGEPVRVQHARVQAMVTLWAAVVDYERTMQRIDRAAAALANAATEGPRAIRGGDALEHEQRAERYAARVMADRLSRVDLWAHQAGLRHVVQAYTDGHGIHRERHLLTAPPGHPALEVQPWEHPSALLVDGQTVVPGVRADTLDAVEDYLGLPHDPNRSGTPRQWNSDAEAGARAGRDR